MAKPTLTYRIWQRAMEWHWQLFDQKRVLASGIETSSVAARTAAFDYCLKLYHSN